MQKPNSDALAVWSKELSYSHPSLPGDHNAEEKLGQDLGNVFGNMLI